MAERFQQKNWCRNEWSDRVGSVKRFERSNGLDTALYKHMLFYKLKCQYITPSHITVSISYCSWLVQKIDRSNILRKH